MDLKWGDQVHKLAKCVSWATAYPCRKIKWGVLAEQSSCLLPPIWGGSQ